MQVLTYSSTVRARYLLIRTVQRNRPVPYWAPICIQDSSWYCGQVKVNLPKEKKGSCHRWLPLKMLVACMLNGPILRYGQCFLSWWPPFSRKALNYIFWSASDTFKVLNQRISLAGRQPAFSRVISKGKLQFLFPASKVSFMCNCQFVRTWSSLKWKSRHQNNDTHY